jgi:serine/threonine protein phosphatase 1
MSQRRIIIGDVHGHFDTLMQLLEAIAPGQNDQVYFLGDLIDRGPKSAEVVEFIIDNNYPCVLGNHEEILLCTIGYGKINSHNLEFWLRAGGNTTLTSYNNEIPYHHLEWMRELPVYRDLGDIFLVHAGVHPHIPLEQQSSEQLCWIRGEFHYSKKPYFPDKLIIVGHTITFTFPNVEPGKLVTGNGWLDIDTGAYHPHSGWLTGLDITNKKVYQVNSQSKHIRIMEIEEAIASNPLD